MLASMQFKQGEKLIFNPNLPWTEAGPMYTLGPAVFLCSNDSQSKPRETPKTRITRKLEKLTSKLILRVKEFSLILSYLRRIQRTSSTATKKASIHDFLSPHVIRHFLQCCAINGPSNKPHWNALALQSETMTPSCSWGANPFRNFVLYLLFLHSLS